MNIPIAYSAGIRNFFLAFPNPIMYNHAENEMAAWVRPFLFRRRLRPLFVKTEPRFSAKKRFIRPDGGNEPPFFRHIMGKRLEKPPYFGIITS